MIDKTNQAAKALLDYSVSLLEATDRQSNRTPLLTDDERVLGALERNGGRVWQSELVDEIGWTKYKLSRLLCRMERDGAIARHRIGNEKLVCLPGNELSVEEMRRLLTVGSI